MKLWGIFFWDKFLLGSPRWPQAQNLSTFASQMLGLKVCTITPSYWAILMWSFHLVMGEGQRRAESKILNSLPCTQVWGQVLEFTQQKEFWGDIKRMKEQRVHELTNTEQARDSGETLAKSLVCRCHRCNLVIFNHFCCYPVLILSVAQR
jgi:hypothetical protein